MTDQLESPLPGRVDLVCRYGYRFDLRAYKLGFNRAMERAREECWRFGYEQSYDLAIDGELPVESFDPVDYAYHFQFLPMDEEKAQESYDQGVAVGMQYYFETAIAPDWHAPQFFLV